MSKHHKIHLIRNNIFPFLFLVDQVISDRGRKSIKTPSFTKINESTVFDSRNETIPGQAISFNWSKSPGLFETCVSTSSETPVTPTISGIPTSTKEAPQLQEDIRTDPSVTVNTSIPEPAPSRIDSEGVTPPTFVAAEFVPSSAPEIFYGADGLPLPPGLIAIEEIVEDPPSSTPSQFGVGITLYPSS